MLCAAISYNTCMHLKYFANWKEVYNEYNGLLIRCSAQHVPEFKTMMWAKMVYWLCIKDSINGANWYERYWTPVHDKHSGAYTLADASYIAFDFEGLTK